MGQTEKIERVKSSIKSFSKAEYSKAELLPELLELQREIVDITFKDTEVCRDHLKIWDAEDYLEQMNDVKGNVAAETFTKFKKESKEVSNYIKSEKSGNRGEIKAQ